MTKDPFRGKPFTVAQGRDAGLGRGAMAGGSFDRPFHGVRERPAESRVAPKPSSDRERLRRLCASYAVRLRAGQFFSHETALVLRGAPAPEGWDPVVHVSTYRPASPPRTKGIIGHRLGPRPSAFGQVSGLPVEHAARAWVQTASLWHSDDLVAAGDHLVARRRKLSTIDGLRAEATLMRGFALDGILDLLRDGSESPRETKLRLLIVRAGLPEPQLNVELFDAEGGFVARVDMAYPEFRVAIEYDGRGHADADQFARDADRWDAIRALGWDHQRILKHHLDDDGGATAVAKVRAALRRAGAAV